jgi:hypothetical protein
MDSVPGKKTMNQDLEHLRLLSIFHYVLAAVTALLSCLPFLHLTIGLLAIFSPETLNGPNGGHDTREANLLFGSIFAIFGGTCILLGWTMCVCIFLAGRNLARRRYMFCLVVAGVMCMMMPFGTILGVFTIIVLVRPSVKLLFEPRSDAAPI